MTPGSRMFFQATGAFAEFERGMIRSRVLAGLERARARGVVSVRPRDLVPRIGTGAALPDGR
jgi:DNA invertase Pin-like site-specific DNA recombinase